MSTNWIGSTKTFAVFYVLFIVAVLQVDDGAVMTAFLLTQGVYGVAMVHIHDGLNVRIRKLEERLKVEAEQ